MFTDKLLYFQGDPDANRPVPFRLTPNIAEFLTSTGVTGPLTAAMVASARCFVQPQYKLPSLLRAVLRDEYITWHKKVGFSPRLKLSQCSQPIRVKIFFQVLSAMRSRYSFPCFFQKQR